jgi:hypothetical protein
MQMRLQELIGHSETPRSPCDHRALHLAFVVVATLAGGCNAVFGIHEGTPPPPCYDPGPAPLLIDDMEDAVGDICNLAGRHGYWYTAGDTTGTMLDPPQGAAFVPTMIPGGRDTSHYAARFTGSGFTDWGALMGFSLDSQNLTNEPYDASSTGGIQFWMKSDVPVTVHFLIPQTVLVTNGGLCAANSTDPNCNSHFSFQITAPSSEWTEFDVPFSALTQENGGSATWNPQLLLGVQFLVAPGAVFDVWVDDVRFYYCPTTGCSPTCVDPAFPVSCPAGASYPAACRPPGTACSAAATWCSNPLLIDDMEDGNSAICNSGGRNGNWYTDADGTEGALSPAQGTAFTMTPIPGGRGDSLVAAHLTASGFDAWAGMGLSLKTVGGVAMPYDASATGGITFWMKTDASTVNVSIPIEKTVPISRGGLCSDSASTFNCDVNFTFYITRPHPDDWFQYYVPYTALYQSGFNTDANGNLLVGSATWDPTQVTGVQFAVNQPASVELWIDDLSFWDCSNETCVPTCTDPAAPVACPALGTTPANCWPAGTDCSTVTRLLSEYYPVSLWGSGPHDVWAVGPKLQERSTAILHWDGSAWSSVESGTTHALWGIWGSSSDDVWSVGDFGAVVHWNGTAWSGSSIGLSDSLNSVWGSSSSDVWVVGANGAIEHWDGASWSAAAGVSSKALYHLWGSGPADVWAVGDGGTIVHWNGTAWSASASGSDSALWSVWGSSPSDVYAVGNTASGAGTILHFDGAVWSPVSIPAAPNPNAVWGSGPDDVWVVGATILHFDGKTWSAVASPTSDYLFAVWGTGPTDAWIAASGTTLHWDGKTWSVVPIMGIPQ